MADELAHFAYEMRLPDGSVVTKNGTAPQAPTLGQLQDYVKSQGGELIRPVEPSVPPPMLQRPPEEAPPTPAPQATPPPAPAPAPGIGAELKRVYLPERTFTSELPSIVGGMAGGTVGFGPWAPLTAGAGSALGETGRIGAEYVMGWPPAEAGTPTERVERAFARGATGEGLARTAMAGGRLLFRGAQPVVKAAEELGPVLTREVPAGQTVLHASQGLGGEVTHAALDTLVKDPAALVETVPRLGPEAQQTVLTRWWQTHAAGGPKSVVAAWDALGEAGQQVLARDQAGALGTVVNTLRGAGQPLTEMSVGQLARSSPVPLALWYSGHPWLAAGAGLASQVATQEVAPRMLLAPGPAGWIAALPKIGRVASPWVMQPVVRFGSQALTAETMP